jgi:hypothetical protein
MVGKIKKGDEDDKSGYQKSLEDPFNHSTYYSISHEALPE